MSEFYDYNFLCHYGIKGMKWGIRRYQNPDGSLTTEGIQRYGSKHGLKKYIKANIKKQKTLQDSAMVSQHAYDAAQKRTEKTKEKYLKTGKSKHLADYLSAKDSESIQKVKRDIQVSQMKEHYNKLVKEFGKENVSNIAMKDGRLNEKTKDGRRIVSSILGTVGINMVGAGMLMGGMPVGVFGAVDYGTTKSYGKRVEKKDYKMFKKENRRVMKSSGQDSKTEYNIQNRQKAIDLANNTPDFAQIIEKDKKKRK